MISILQICRKFTMPTCQSLNRMYSTTDLITVEKVHCTTLIGINRPLKRNCINHESAKALLEAFKRFNEDDTSVAAILYGIGGNFCAGYDLEEIADDKLKIKEIIQEIQNTPGMGPMGPTYYESKKPVIAAVEGYAVAGGLELALWCDIRIVDRTACFAVLNRRFGVPLIDGGTVRLPAIVGLGRAMELILSGRRINGDEAFNIGLANQSCNTGSAIGVALRWAGALRKFPQNCLQRDKRLIYEAAYGREALQNELQSVTPEILQEAVEGARKFLDGVGKHGSSTLDSYESITKDFDVTVH